LVQSGAEEHKPQPQDWKHTSYTSQKSWAGDFEHPDIGALKNSGQFKTDSRYPQSYR